MQLTTFSLSEDLSLSAQVVVIALLVITLGLLAYDVRRRSRSGVWVWLSGALGAVALCAAILRPTWVMVSGLEAAPRVVALVDGSHRLTLPADDPALERRQVASEALADLQQAWHEARLEHRLFGDGELLEKKDHTEPIVFSDLTRSVSELLSSPEEKPRAIVVFSDGRLAAPGPVHSEDWGQELRHIAQGVPLHTVSVAEKVPADRSIRSVGTTGTALAHQPFRLRIQVGCAPPAQCQDAEVVVRELLEGRPAELLADGVAKGGDGLLELELEVTLERAGARVIEVALADSNDSLLHNDRRLLPIEVRRDRTRILHVAGRPTYDVRALRMFLKADESIDLISFFILRTEDDDVQASQDELALIPFPVEELFTEHLPSFDAVVLQDIDAREYKLDRHFRSLQKYVLSGGGLIMVGGPSGFTAGGYAESPIEEVLPVELPSGSDTTVLGEFTPDYTRAGRAAPMLKELRQLLSDALPEMSGYNQMGLPKPGALVLWEHPDETALGASASRRMPLLTLGEVGDGRSIALAVDATHKLRFGRLGARAAGEAHGALWEGLLGWLMRDPRFEAAQARLEGPCIEGYPAKLLVTTLPGMDEQVSVTVSPLKSVGADAKRTFEPTGREGQALVFLLEGLEPGGYAARVAVGSAPPARFVFACEVGGEAHADSRPDAERLAAISEATGGLYKTAANASELPRPEATFVAAQRRTRPISPPWVWSLTAAFLLGIHWLIRRAAGFS